jgi:hypothetical protein
MTENNKSSWLTRKMWAVVLLPVLAAVLLAGVSVFQGWLHRSFGFDDKGNRLLPDREQPAATASKPRSPVSPPDAARLLVEDLQRRPVEVRPRLRYLSLVHRHNEPSCSDAQLEAERAAVRDVLGVLSSGKTEVVLIDPHQVLFRIDLADLGWDAAIEWHKVAAQYRYGLRPTGEPQATLHQQIEEQTQDPIPCVRADWFVAALTRPPLAGDNRLLRKPASEFPESVRLLARHYAAQALDLEAGARELGVADPRTVRELIAHEETLQQEFGLAPWLRGETIRREWWEGDRNFLSPYQELARRLQLGKPVRVQ